MQLRQFIDTASPAASTAPYSEDWKVKPTYRFAWGSADNIRAEAVCKSTRVGKSSSPACFNGIQISSDGGFSVLCPDMFISQAAGIRRKRQMLVRQNPRTISCIIRFTPIPAFQNYASAQNFWNFGFNNAPTSALPMPIRRASSLYAQRAYNRFVSWRCPRSLIRRLYQAVILNLINQRRNTISPSIPTSSALRRVCQCLPAYPQQRDGDCI